jgi:hypothetical protein
MLRKMRSAWVRCVLVVRSQLLRLAAERMQDGIAIGAGFIAGRAAKVACSDGGRIELGERVTLGAGTRIESRGGRITVGSDVFVGDGCVVVSCDSIEIGAGTQIAEYVVIRDQDHRMHGAPLRSSGFETSPVSIGSDCWLGAKVTVLRGARIGDGTVIGAHSLVKGGIPGRTLAVGCPARVVRRLDGETELPLSVMED